MTRGLIKVVSSVAAAALLSTQVHADADTTTANISVDGTGQFLIAPAFYSLNYTGGDYSTKLKVVNTDTDSAVWVRVVVRDKVCSQEVDFPILLSPGDVWTATISNDGTNSYITSTDDSNAVSSIASGISLTSIGGADFQRGYVEFYPLFEVDLNDDQANDGLSGYSVDKDDMKALWEAITSEGSPLYPSGITAGVTTVPATGYGQLNSHVLQQVNDETMAGYVSIMNSSTSQPVGTTLNMLAFEDVIQLPDLPTPVSMTASANTNPDSYLGGTGSDMVDSLLQTTEIAVPYDSMDDNTVQFVTFWNDTAGCTAPYQARTYDLTVRDEHEKQPGVVQETCEISPCEATTTYSDQLVYELAEITVYSAIVDNGVQYTDGTSDYDYSRGWVHFTNLANTSSTNQLTQRALTRPAAIPTQLNAMQVNSSDWTINWTYSPKTLTNDSSLTRAN